jgi:ABC-type Mn2+/Zn2+ transport system ATPase subunit
MRLVAIYIPSETLPHIFGENHNGQTINLGGKYIYTFEENANGDVYIQDKMKNEKFIANFWLNNITLVSAIVGENGTGKTTILNLLREPYSYCKYIYEDLNSDELIITDDAEINEIIYYSSFFNINQSDSENGNFRDLSKYQMMIDDTEYENLDLTTLLELHNSENLKRWIKFIELKNLSYLLEEMSLPTFDKIKIKIHSINIDEHQTSYKFRPFFDKLKERIGLERTEREQAELDRLKLTEVEDIRNSRATQKIKLELEIISRVILKTQNILESTGNRYLQEGHLENNYTIKSEEFINQPNTKDAFYWFLENSFIQLTQKSEKIRFPIIEIKTLIETLLSYIPESEKIDNWTEFDVDFTQALEIIKAYENFLLVFKDKFAYDKKVLMSFSPSKNLSSGEKGLYDLFSVLNDLNYRIEKNIHKDYGIFNKREKVSNNLLILLDEADLGFHPEWKKKYVNIIQQVIPFIFKNKNIQIIITTHDPLTLSDFPNNNIVYLLKRDKRTEVLDYDSKKRPTKTFGANISDLLADSFFVDNGLIGDFAKIKIEETIKWINKNSDPKNRDKDLFFKEIKYHKQIISIIDESIVKIKLSEMISDLEDINDFQKQILNDEIKFLTNKRDKLK